MIRVKNLYKEFDGRDVLKDISIDYKPGECSLIIGASGSGKTVLLKSLVGLHTPDRGEIWYGDKLFTQMKEKEKKDEKNKETWTVALNAGVGILSDRMRRREGY